MKRYFYLFLVAIFVFPFCVSARSLEEAKDLLDSFGEEISIKAVNPYSLNYYKEIDDEDEWYEWYNVINGFFKLYLLNDKDSSLNVVINNSPCHFIDEGKSLKIDVSYDDNGIEYNIDRTIPVKFEELNATELANAKKITDEIEYYYSLSGMNSINSLYHYGYLATDIDSTAEAVARFPQLKKIMEKYPEYDFEVVFDRGGGVPNWEERYAYIGVFKNGVLYSYKEILLHIDEVVFVDKDKSGSLPERAKDRLNDYFKGDVKVTVDENVEEWTEETINYFKEDFKDINVYDIVSTNITIGDKQFFMMIVETDSNGIDKKYVESSDKETGVSIQTESYDVPVDAIVKVKDVSSEEYVKKAVEDNNMKIIKVYDIDLERYSDKKLVKDIKNGLDIYIPIENATEGDEITIYYINSDGKITEEIKGIVIKQDNKLYVKFTTNHLSTYAILEKEEVDNSTDEVVVGDKEDEIKDEVKEVTPVTNETNDEKSTVPLVDNPQTGDNIITYVIILTLSIIGLIGSVFYFRKKYN